MTASPTAQAAARYQARAEMPNGRTWIRHPSDLRNHDDRAAFVCALTALSVATGEFTAVGDERGAWIILPPQMGIRRLGVDRGQ